MFALSEQICVMRKWARGERKFEAQEEKLSLLPAELICVSSWLLRSFRIHHGRGNVLSQSLWKQNQEVQTALPQSRQGGTERTFKMEKMEILSKWRKKEIERKMKRYAWLDKLSNAWLKWLNCYWQLKSICMHVCVCVTCVFMFSVSQCRGDESIFWCHKTLRSCTYPGSHLISVPAKLTCPLMQHTWSLR